MAEVEKVREGEMEKNLGASVLGVVFKFSDA